VVHALGDADREFDAAIRAVWRGAADLGVGLGRAVLAGAREVLEVEEREVLVLPRAVLIEDERDARAIGRDELHVVDVEPEVTR
jgi:hypothetical protein